MSPCVVITGAGRGIGAATAKFFAKNGARVVLMSRTPIELFGVASSINAAYGKDKAIAIVGDVSKAEDIERLFNEAKGLGGVDVLINNAATVLTKSLLDTSEEDWNRVFSVNVSGAFLCAKAALKQMREKAVAGKTEKKERPCIINISSLGGLQGIEKFPGLGAYSASKAAVVGLSESLAVEAKEFGVRVYCVAPGAVETKMLKEAAPFLKTKTMPEDIAEILFNLIDEAKAAKFDFLIGILLQIYSNLEN